jgi:hypothetical protein
MKKIYWHPKELHLGARWAKKTEDIDRTYKKEYEIVLRTLDQALGEVRDKQTHLIAEVIDSPDKRFLVIRTRKRSLEYPTREIDNHQELAILYGLMESAIQKKRSQGYNIWRE